MRVILFLFIILFCSNCALIVAKETVKAVAEELDIKPSLINKAIKIAQKGEWQKVYDEFDDLETLVTTVGHDK